MAHHGGQRWWRVTYGPGDPRKRQTSESAIKEADHDNGNPDDRNLVSRTHKETVKFATWSFEDNMTAWAA